MAISMKIACILSSAVLLLIVDSGFGQDDIPMGIRCPKCTEDDIAKCPTVVPSATCEVIDEPNCGCCQVCAGSEGDYCGVGRPNCKKSLNCDSPCDGNSFMSDMDLMLSGRWICKSLPEDEVNLPDFLYGDDQEPVYVPPIFHPCPMEMTTTTSMMVPSSRLPSSPPSPPFPDDPLPCHRHYYELQQQEPTKFEWSPSCYEDGTYDEQQCERTFGLVVGRCWCADSRGNPTTKLIERINFPHSACYGSPLSKTNE